MSSRHVIVLVNGPPDSGVGARARGLFDPLEKQLRVTYLYRESGRLSTFLQFYVRVAIMRPDLVYALDAAIASAGAALAVRLTLRTRFVLDTGDLAYELARATGRFGLIGRGILRYLEGYALRSAAAVIVRGTLHKELLERAGRASVYLIRDGVHTRPLESNDDRLRRDLGLDGALCVGMMGSISWNRRTHLCYGWDLIQALSLLPEAAKVCVVIVGDGDGLPHLRKQAAELGVADRVRFIGRVPYDDVSRYLHLFDIAVSTQTNDLVGHVRTTGKLPEYMAAGCYVLATDVGEARLLLPDQMRLPYEGVKDLGHPQRLARRIQEIAALEPEERERAGRELATRARAELDYRLASGRLNEILDGLMPPAVPSPR